MLRELAFFGALAPSLLLYFLAAIRLFVIVDWLVAHLRVYQFVWHPVGSKNWNGREPASQAGSV